jgi:hypothetical protein
MNNEAMKEVLNELFSHLERLETQSEAILQFLKEEKRVTDKQLAPYLEQAGNASNVKWRAARVRIDHLLSPEHPEKEIKLGKKPELHEAPSIASSTGSPEGKRSEPSDQEAKRSDSADQEGKRSESAAQEVKRSESENQPGKRSEPSDQEGKRAELGDLLSGDSNQGNKDKSETDDVKTPPAEVKAEKPEVKSDSATASKKVATQSKGSKTSDAQDTRHPMEGTQPLAEQEGAEPAAQLKSDKTDSEKEAA